MPKSKNLSWGLPDCSSLALEVQPHTVEQHFFSINNLLEVVALQTRDFFSIFALVRSCFFFFSSVEKCTFQPSSYRVVVVVASPSLGGVSSCSSFSLNLIGFYNLTLACQNTRSAEKSGRPLLRSLGHFVSLKGGWTDWLHVTHRKNLANEGRV